MKFIASFLGSAFILGMAFNASAETPPYVTIPPVVNSQANPSYGGTGCPAGTARAVVSPDLKSFTMIFDEYVASAKGSNGLDRKNCQIIVNFEFPQGWSYSIIRMDYRGFYNLSAGATAKQQSLYYFQGSLQQGRLFTLFTGPTQGDYTISDTLGVNDVVWSPCGDMRALNINTSLLASVGANNPNGYSHLTTDSVDGNVQTTYALQWKKCTK
ncbi:DUF4360 domain-containing protein [Fluviispira multicolorata]|uniref:DUF4360 domain-containing protein n=1 Tax=Fluviispira multicolorata TaxID=2654512 RepID=A0A833JBX3_9BACT|nr:DUF4360 domain-containing protein [Fluviispira multicolorata]KAB8029218.1 DUF4360 domain-containing protein [Fluviispira multicolorata]